MKVKIGDLYNDYVGTPYEVVEYNKGIIKFKVANEWFEEYTAVCISHFGDKVNYWMILNEPMVFTGAGYFLGIHAPGKKGISNFAAALHHAALCQAIGFNTIKKMITRQISHLFISAITS